MLTPHVRKLEDVKTIFGDVALQASLTDKFSLRQTYKIVGSPHQVHYWSKNDQPKAALEVFRPYYVGELYPSEKA